jgi:hypothetical protein
MLNSLVYLHESIMIVSEGVKLSAAEIKKSVAISIYNVVTLACLKVNEVQDLLYVNLKPLH